MHGQNHIKRNNVVNWTTCFGLLGGHHQIQQAILSPIACSTWWWPPSRLKCVVQLTTLLRSTCCVWLTYLYLYVTQWGCLNSRLYEQSFIWRYNTL